MMELEPVREKNGPTPSGTPAESLDRHDREIRQNREAFARKPVLAEVYSDLYRRAAAHLPGEPGLRTIVELGSGMGNIKTHVPDCVTTDLFPNQSIDRVEDVYALGFEDRSVDGFVLLDVFHHLRFPGAALREMARCLGPRGRVVLVEPDMGMLGRWVYGCFHPEPLGLADEIEWDVPEEMFLEKGGGGYYAAQGNAHRIFVKSEGADRIAPFRVAAVERIAAVSYVASGGFSGPQLYPRCFLPLMRFLDRLAGILPSVFSTRLLVVLETDNVSA